MKLVVLNWMAWSWIYFWSQVEDSFRVILLWPSITVERSSSLVAIRPCPLQTSSVLLKKDTVIQAFWWKHLEHPLSPLWARDKETCPWNTNVTVWCQVCHCNLLLLWCSSFHYGESSLLKVTLLLNESFHHSDTCSAAEGEQNVQKLQLKCQK